MNTLPSVSSSSIRIIKEAELVAYGKIDTSENGLKTEKLVGYEKINDIVIEELVVPTTYQPISSLFSKMMTVMRFFI
jgi:hypothetical protein